MMKWVFSGIIIVSVIFGFFTNSMGEISNAILDCGKSTISLFLILAGSMAVWGGLMRIAEKSNITSKVSNLFKPITKRLFKGLKSDGEALKAISMNITANLLGLGNAATPLGIKAIEEIKKEERLTDKASRNMVLFTVINTASIQLIPATIATLRLEYGSKDPMSVLPAILIVSVIALTVGISNVFIFDFIGKGTDKNKNN